MKPAYLLTVLCIILGVSPKGYAQQVISSAGKNSGGITVDLSWTIGEPISSTGYASTFDLGQGFHQSFPMMATERQTLIFTTGWNLFSVFVMPAGPDLRDMFSPLIAGGELVRILDEQGNALENLGTLGGWQNFIGDIEFSEGYKIKVTQPCQLPVEGTRALLPMGIPLRRGWNIVGFPRDMAADARAVFQQLIDRGTLLKVQDEAGNAYEDLGSYGGWINFIGNCLPGKGYKVRVSGDDQLVIQESYPKSASATMALPLPVRHFRLPWEGNGLDHMNIFLAGIPEGLLDKEDEIAVFDGSLCVGGIRMGEAQLDQKLLQLTVSADDGNGGKGFSEGHSFTLRLYKPAMNKEYALGWELLEGTTLFNKHGSTLLRLSEGALTHHSGNPWVPATEVRCYPNPFNRDLRIFLFLPAAAQVTIDAFQPDGRKVGEPVSRELRNAGEHTFTWSGAGLTPGVYFLRIKAGVEEFHQKVIFNREY